MVLKSRIKRICKNKKGEANYLSMTVSMLIICMCIAFLLNLFSVLYGKFQLDQAANEVVKLVQLEGGVPHDINEFINEFDETNNNLNGITLSYYSPTVGTSTPSDMYAAYQLGEQFTIALSSEVYLGIGGVMGSNITIKSAGVGVSEHYHK